MADTVNITRDYTDNFSIKEYVVDDLVPKYFDNIDASVRTSGLIGETTELISNISEDAFNTASVYFREAFVNRAQVDESIYSHAAIFQIHDVFSVAARCRFLVVLEEEAIIKNMVNNYDRNTGIYSFFIGRDTTIYVEGIPFVFDYPVAMSIVKKTSDDGDEYLFTAKYIMDEYKNSISTITDPYIKIRRNNNGYVAMEVICHQCRRDVREEAIVSNNVVNYPIIDIDFDGKLAGFDILYKTIRDADFNTQFETRLIYSQPTKNPFCYYQILNNSTLRITFNTKDNYYMPEYNSDIKVILYITEGKNGNFTSYNGNNISMTTDNASYAYEYSYLTAASPLSSSDDGKDQTDIDTLQALATEGYRTANALTTENDLNEYFNNYKYRYSDSSDVKFIRRRDDVYERVYAAYILMRDDDYIYKTNTLNLKLNLSEMENSEQNVYILEPGYLFTANDSSGYAEFYRDENKNAAYYADYLNAIKEGTIDYISETTSTEELPAYLLRPASFAEYKARNNLEDKLSVFDQNSEVLAKLDDPINKKFLLINPFLIRFKKMPNLVSAYMTYIDESNLLDFDNQNDMSYVQFILYTLRIQRNFEKAKRYVLSTNIGPSISINRNYPIVAAESYTDEGDIASFVVNNRFAVEDNDLRVFLIIKDENKNDVCYTEMYPTSYNPVSRSFTYEASFFTDDHITSNGKLRIEPGIIFRNKETGQYYKVHKDDNTLYDLYDSNDNVLSYDIPVDTVTELLNEGTVYKYTTVVNMTATSDILIPMEDVVCEVYTLYRRIYSEEAGGLIPTTSDQTNNKIVDFDPSLDGYIWTNVYTTDTYRMTFLKSLDNMRINLTFEDYTIATKSTDADGNEVNVFEHDIMDSIMYNIPFCKYDIALDESKASYFMSTFYNQYEFLNDVSNTALRGSSILDTKFYNTYGRSLNFIIGEDNEIIDTINLHIAFDIWYVPGTEISSANTIIKNFIKSDTETINEYGQNNLYISNLIRKIENNFAFVDHIRFKGINTYDTVYQAVKNKSVDLNDLTVSERRWYVPEFLVTDIDTITLNAYFSDET